MINEQDVEHYKQSNFKQPDPVNPDHYKQTVECIDAIQSAITGLESFEAMCTGNAIKYLWRWKRKNGIEDLEKAMWYIKRIVNATNPN